MSPDNGSNFYTSLPVIEDFFDASNQDNYHTLPSDWYVAITDIVNSTEAIDAGDFKRVNILGASPIVGILNIAGRNEIPYVFGGDGSSFCIPPDLYEKCRKVLAGSRQVGREEYDLELRAAIIPISFILQQGYDLNVARYRASEHYIQGVFSGGGISYAEHLVKASEIEEYRISAAEHGDEVNFSGLECRWQEVRQPNKEILTLLVKTNPALDSLQEVYQEVLQRMRDIFGFDNKTNPINASQLNMNLSFTKLMDELKIRTFGKGWLSKLAYLLKAELQIIVGKLLMALNLETSATDWALYKSDMTLNSDHRKFDDMLRLVISGRREQRQQLENFLDKQFENNKLAYGLHITDAAMITCMVFNYHRDHIHFVDGSGGGYVSASKGLKERLSVLKED